MMKLSDGVEWGAHVTTLLAVLPPGRALPAAKLAEYHGVPAAYLAKHLQALSRAGILESVQGPRGGYRLARPGVGDHAARRRGGDRRRRARVPLHRDPATGSDRATGVGLPTGVRHPPRDGRGRRRWRSSLRAVTVAELVDGVMRDASPAGLAAGAAWIQEAIA